MVTFSEENWSILLGSIKQFSLVSLFERVRSLLLRVRSGSFKMPGAHSGCSIFASEIQTIPQFFMK